MSDFYAVDTRACGQAPPECGSSQRQRAVGARAQDWGSETCGHGHLEDTRLKTEDNRIHKHRHTLYTPHINYSSPPVYLYVCPTQDLVQHCATQASISILQYLSMDKLMAKFQRVMIWLISNSLQAECINLLSTLFCMNKNPPALFIFNTHISHDSTLSVCWSSYTCIHTTQTVFKVNVIVNCIQATFVLLIL